MNKRFLIVIKDIDGNIISRGFLLSEDIVDAITFSIRMVRTIKLIGVDVPGEVTIGEVNPS